VLDLGTGSGILLAAILLEMRNSTGIGIDRSAGALAIARDNLHALGAGDRARFICGDWANALGSSFDLVVANPPYIRSGDISGLPLEVRGHDPSLALDGGADGLNAYRTIAAQLPRLLAADGVAVLELGFGQESAVARLAYEAGLFVTGPARRDLAGVPRALVLWSQAKNNAWNSPRSALVSGTDST
jgi:release factor glutamine methyltransferase